MKSSNNRFWSISGWQFFVIVSGIAVVTCLTVITWVKLDYKTIKGISGLLGSITWIFILREFGMLKRIKGIFSSKSH
jgi:hypothetical protein